MEKSYHVHENILFQIQNGSKPPMDSLLAMAIMQKGISLDLQKLIVSHYDLSQYSNLDIDPSLKFYNKFLQLHANLKMSAAKEVLKTLNIQHSFSAEYPFLEFYGQNLTTDELTIDQLHFIQEVETNTLSAIELYSFISALGELSTNAVIGTDLELRLSLIHYGLYLIETNHFAQHFTHLKADLLYKKAIQLMAEANDYEQAIEVSLRDSKKCFRQINEQNFVSLIDWHLTDNNPNLEKIKSYGALQLPKKVKLGLLIDVGIALMQQNKLDEAEVMFDQANLMIDDNTCLFSATWINYFQGSIAFERKDYSGVKNLFAQASLIGKCSSRDTLLNQYVFLQNQQLLLHEFLEESKAEANRKTMLLERNLAKKILKKDSKHWDDYLSEYAIRMFNNYLGKKISNERTINYLLKTSFHAKDRAVNSKKTEDLNFSLKRSNLRRNQIIKEINDFKTNSNLGNSDYEDILNFTINEFQETKHQSHQFTEDVNNDTINFTKTNQQQFFGINTFKNENFGYFLSKNELSIFKLDSDTLEQLVNALNKKISDQKTFSTEIKELKNYFSSYLQIVPLTPLAISPDGSTTTLPWHLIFDNNPDIQLISQANELLSTKATIVNSNSAALFSFTNRSTEADSKTIRKVRELPYAYKECSKIANILGLSEESIYSGKQCSRDNLNQSVHLDLLHFATHAFSNNANRLDNYMLLRDVEGSPNQLYSFEIEALDLVPKVVMLSACETDLGLQRDGAGTYSLSRAFLKNGTNTVVSTLWKVNDEKSAEFMSKLYGNWSAGLSLHEALIQTRQDYKNHEIDLLQWGAFILEGEGNVYLN